MKYGIEIEAKGIIYIEKDTVDIDQLIGELIELDIDVLIDNATDHDFEIDIVEIKKVGVKK